MFAENPKPRFSVALTGGVASGKSAVAERFARLGVPVFDADVVAHDLVQPGRPALAQIAKTFGNNFVNATGELDRRRLRELIFADAAARRALEAILHPVISAQLRRDARGCEASYSLLVIPLLTEAHAEYTWVDRVLVVDVPQPVQLDRLMQRDGIDRSLALSMLAVQATRQQRLALADDIVDNTGPYAALDAAVSLLRQRYLASAPRQTEGSDDT